MSLRALRWLVPAAALALTPKCLLCVLAYVGLGAALGLGGPQICGAAPSSAAGPLLWLAMGAVAAAMLGLFVCRRHSR